MKDIKIIVATHKNYRMPEDSIYVPLHVGAEGKQALDIEGVIRDNEGENISDKNANWCELTGLYWAWKNLSCDYIGLAHYRRHFVSLNGKILPGEICNNLLHKVKNKKSGSKSETKWNKVIGRAELEALLDRYYILLPKARNYYIETNYSHYAHAHHVEDIDMTREIIGELCPEYLPAFDESMQRTTGHRFNMFIMKKSLADDYCEWLFSILEELEKRADISGYSKYDSRLFGFISERLLDVWLMTKGYEYGELPYEFMEDENWIKKGGAFIKRKIKGINKEGNKHLDL